MYKVTKQFSFCCAHRLYKHPGPCGQLHGHNYRVFVTMRSEKLDTESHMVIDFATLKREIQGLLNDMFDHTTVLWEDDPLRQEIKSVPIFPFSMQPTAEGFAVVIFKTIQVMPFYIRDIQPKGIEIEKVIVYETETSYAEFIS